MFLHRVAEMFSLLIVTVVLCGAGAGGRGGPTRRRRKTTWSHTTRWFCQNYLTHSSFDHIHSAFSKAGSLGVTPNSFTPLSKAKYLTLKWTAELAASKQHGGLSLYIISWVWLIPVQWSARFEALVRVAPRHWHLRVQLTSTHFFLHVCPQRLTST